MAISDHVSNLLARIRNAQVARFDHLEVPATKLVENVALILKEEGFIKSCKVVQEKGRAAVRISLKPIPGTGYAIKGMRRVSRPGRRVYVGKDDIPTVRNGFGISILSTSQGVMTGDKARKMSTGGEILCEVW